MNPFTLFIIANSMVTALVWLKKLFPFFLFTFFVVFLFFRFVFCFVFFQNMSNFAKNAICHSVTIRYLNLH